ncbi:MAG: hypothetical protein IPQ04_09205 [Saprospiraceae bacterium]|nr:hypothetical protein [Saprospiraceae bacterium]
MQSAPKLNLPSEVISKEKSETKEDLAPYTLTDKEGKTLTIEFNHKRDQVSLNFNGRKYNPTKRKTCLWNLVRRRPIRELRGKGNDVELTKEGKVIFHIMMKSTAEAKDKIWTNAVHWNSQYSSHGL